MLHSCFPLFAICIGEDERHVSVACAWERDPRAAPTLGKPGVFLCPALAARGWAWRAPPGRRERVTNALTAQSQSVRCRAVYMLHSHPGGEGRAGAVPACSTNTRPPGACPYWTQGRMRDFAKAFYKSKAWQRTRAAYAASVGGLCEDCLRDGVIKSGEIVHHKRPLTPENISDPAVTLSFDNLELLCRDCHARRHGNKKRYRVDPMGRVIPHR